MTLNDRVLKIKIALTHHINAMEAELKAQPSRQIWQQAAAISKANRRWMIQMPEHVTILLQTALDQIDYLNEDSKHSDPESQQSNDTRIKEIRTAMEFFLGITTSPETTAPQEAQGSKAVC